MGEYRKELGSRLRHSRESRGLKQYKVAKLVGIHNSTLAKYESGEREPDNVILMELAELYEVTFDWISTGRSPVIEPQPVISIEDIMNDHIDSPELRRFFLEVLASTEQSQRELLHLWNMLKYAEIGRRLEQQEQRE